jgi:hypothetical protein
MRTILAAISVSCVLGSSSFAQEAPSNQTAACNAVNNYRVHVSEIMQRAQRETNPIRHDELFAQIKPTMAHWQGPYTSSLAAGVHDFVGTVTELSANSGAVLLRLSLCKELSISAAFATDNYTLKIQGEIGTPLTPEYRGVLGSLKVGDRVLISGVAYRYDVYAPQMCAVSCMGPEVIRLGTRAIRKF